MVGLMILQQICDITDDEAVVELTFVCLWSCASGIT